MSLGGNRARTLRNVELNLHRGDEVLAAKKGVARKFTHQICGVLFTCLIRRFVPAVPTSRKPRSRASSNPLFDRVSVLLALGDQCRKFVAMPGSTTNCMATSGPVSLDQTASNGQLGLLRRRPAIVG